MVYRSVDGKGSQDRLTSLQEDHSVCLVNLRILFRQVKLVLEKGSKWRDIVSVSEFEHENGRILISKVKCLLLCTICAFREQISKKRGSNDSIIPA